MSETPARARPNRLKRRLIRANARQSTTPLICGKCHRPFIASLKDMCCMTQIASNKLRPIHALENKSVQRIPDLETRTPIPHLSLRQKLGFHPVLVCLHCKASLEVDYSVGGMKARLMRFCDEHEECKPKEEVSA